MDYDSYIYLDSDLLEELRALAALRDIHIDDYITSLLEEEVLKEITIRLASISSIK